jgi:hypothetical protein
LKQTYFKPRYFCNTQGYQWDASSRNGTQAQDNDRGTIEVGSPKPARIAVFGRPGMAQYVYEDVLNQVRMETYVLARPGMAQYVYEDVLNQVRTEWDCFLFGLACAVCL